MPKVSSAFKRLAKFPDMIIVLFFLFLFIYILFSSLEWPLTAALFPRVVASAGILLTAVLLIIRLRQLSSHWKHGMKEEKQEQILDVGTSFADLPKEMVKARIVRMFISLTGLFIGVWLVGFHLAIPLFLIFYLIRYGEMKWWQAVVVAAVIEVVLLYGMYHVLVNTSWNEPILFQIFNG